MTIPQSTEFFQPQTKADLGDTLKSPEQHKRLKIAPEVAHV
jgi:hypothetical protein